jgi:hypothetical protein
MTLNFFFEISKTLLNGMIAQGVQRGHKRQKKKEKVTGKETKENCQQQQKPHS